MRKNKVNVIKFETCYNANVMFENSISSIKDLKEKIKKCLEF